MGPRIGEERVDVEARFGEEEDAAAGLVDDAQQTVDRLSEVDRPVNLAGPGDPLHRLPPHAPEQAIAAPAVGDVAGDPGLGPFVGAEVPAAAGADVVPLGRRSVRLGPVARIAIVELVASADRVDRALGARLEHGVRQDSFPRGEAGVPAGVELGRRQPPDVPAALVDRDQREVLQPFVPVVPQQLPRQIEGRVAVFLLVHPSVAVRVLPGVAFALPLPGLDDDDARGEHPAVAVETVDAAAAGARQVGATVRPDEAGVVEARELRIGPDVRPDGVDGPGRRRHQGGAEAQLSGSDFLQAAEEHV